MSNKRKEIPTRFPSWVPWAAFAVGLAGAVSLRLILLADAYRPELIRLFWYLGVVGNMFFFLFRSYITIRRTRLIKDLELLKKLEDGSPLDATEYKAVKYLVASLKVSKELWNYAVITIFSLLAIAWDIFYPH